MRMSRLLWIAFLVCLTINGSSEARHHPSAAVLVGTVYCDTCFHQDFPKSSHFISGASVEVECEGTRNGESFREEVKTDEHGEFKVHLPLSVSKHVKKIKGCSVKLINSSEPYCGVASSATSSSIHLKEKKEGKHIFSAGFFTFKPLNQPELCNQKPSKHGFSKPNDNATESPVTDPDNPAFSPPIQDPPASTPLLPPIPGVPALPVQLPLPPGAPGNPLNPTAARQKATFSKNPKLKSKYLNPDDPAFFPPIGESPPPDLLTPIIKGGIIPPLPELPPLLPGIPLVPSKAAREAQVTDEKNVLPELPPLPPNPFLPPPSQLPPNPFLPPRSQLPPNSVTTPPPSVQPPNPFPTPLPGFPFQPPPLTPGAPQAATQKNSP